RRKKNKCNCNPKTMDLFILKRSYTSLVYIRCETTVNQNLTISPCHVMTLQFHLHHCLASQMHISCVFLYILVSTVLDTGLRKNKVKLILIYFFSLGSYLFVPNSLKCVSYYPKRKNVLKNELISKKIKSHVSNKNANNFEIIPYHDDKGLNGRHKQRSKASTPQIIRKSPLEAELGARLHAPQVIKRNHPTNGQISHIPHNLGRPSQAQDQRQYNQWGNIKTQSSNHSQDPEGNPQEPCPEHQVSGMVYVREFGNRVEGLDEDLRAEACPFWKQTRRMPAARVKKKELQIMKWTMNLGHTRTAFCQAKASVMLRRDAASTWGRKYWRTLCSRLRARPCPIRTSTPLNIKNPMSPTAKTVWRMNTKREILFVYDLELSVATDGWIFRYNNQRTKNPGGAWRKTLDFAGDVTGYTSPKEWISLGVKFLLHAPAEVVVASRSNSSGA
ncbi:Unknown protein, partial [Striga hermonthica]